MWTRIHEKKWIRSDNAVVKYDHTRECSTSKPWLPGHRGFMAYMPGDDEHAALCYRRKGSRFKIRRKFKTPEAAMAALDREYPSSE